MIKGIFKRTKLNKLIYLLWCDIISGLTWAQSSSCSIDSTAIFWVICKPIWLSMTRGSDQKSKWELILSLIFLTIFLSWSFLLLLYKNDFVDILLAPPGGVVAWFILTLQQILCTILLIRVYSRFEFQVGHSNRSRYN